MKKLLSALIAFTIVLSFGVNSKAEALSTTESQTEEVKVSPQVYSFLLERAGFAAYIDMNETISMNPQNVSNFIIEEKFEGFFIGRFTHDANKILVTKDGLIISYTPKKLAHMIYTNDLHFKDVQSTVKIFVGPTITKVDYINFASFDSNKAISYRSADEAVFNIPTDATINTISYASTPNSETSEKNYGTLDSRPLQPGATHLIRDYGKYIDDILVFNQNIDAMNIFYKSKEAIDVEGTEDYVAYDLTNKFVLDTSIVPEKELMKINIKGQSTLMKLGEVQEIQVTGLYDDGSQVAINSADVKWTSSRPAVAQVKNGSLEALSPGATIIIATYNGKTSFIVIEVENYYEFEKELDVAVDKKWNITFSAPVDIDTAVEENIYITDANGKIVPVHYIMAQEDIVRVNPREDYTPGQSYTLWVKDVKSTTGKTIKQYTKMDFTVVK